jgi:DNA ligase D-like protein (predicted 3'-phosphoesterase)
MRFVVHHHAARNTHYDLRLEMEGVLRSWAVPKGPSPNVKDKRFAALVEDHPLEYGDFEGKIPEGNYGAGWSIVWDRGYYRPIGDPVEGLAKGKILFELHGQKLHGKWTLVRLKGKDKDWLFIKEIDEQMDESLGTDDYPMNSYFRDFQSTIWMPVSTLKKRCSVPLQKPNRQHCQTLRLSRCLPPRGKPLAVKTGCSRSNMTATGCCVSKKTMRHVLCRAMATTCLKPFQKSLRQCPDYPLIASSSMVKPLCTIPPACPTSPGCNAAGD